jgi:hypothetical protein
LVTIDSGIHSGTRPVLNVGITLSGVTGMAAALLGLSVMAAHGFDDDGVRLGSQITWRFASFVFFAAVAAGPLCRLIPLEVCKRLDGARRQLIWSFCASYAVFLASLLLPNSLGGVTHDDATAGMILFSLFGGLAVVVMAYAASRHAAAQVGEKSRLALLSVAASFFWLTYALTGLAHLSGPHRPDAFYGVSLSLMIIALLLRFADRFVAKLRETSAIPGL